VLLGDVLALDEDASCGAAISDDGLVDEIEVALVEGASRPLPQIDGLAAPDIRLA
jgi:hypothetical protein